MQLRSLSSLPKTQFGGIQGKGNIQPHSELLHKIMDRLVATQSPFPFSSLGVSYLENNTMKVHLKPKTGKYPETRDLTHPLVQTVVDVLAQLGAVEIFNLPPNSPRTMAYQGHRVEVFIPAQSEMVPSCCRNAPPHPH